MKDLHLLHLQNKSKSEMSLSLEFGSDPFLLPRLLAGGPGLGHYGVDLSLDFYFIFFKFSFSFLNLTFIQLRILVPVQQ